MPLVDPQSLVLFAAGSVAIALVLCFVLRRHRAGDRAIRWLIASNVLLFGAALGVLMRPTLGFEVGALQVIAGLYAGICCAYFAVLSAEDKPVPWQLYTGIGLANVAVQAWLVMTGVGVTTLMASTSVVNTGVTAAMVFGVWRLTRPHGARMATLLCLPFAALCLGYAVRLPVVALAADDSASVAASLLIIVVMAWAAVILELGLIALRERQVRRQLRAALDQAEAASAARTRLLLGLSHEFRTPLNGISGLTALMQTGIGGPYSDTSMKFLAQIHDNTDALTALIDRLLEHTAGDAPEQNGMTIEDAIRWKFDEADEAAMLLQARNPPGERPDEAVTDANNGRRGTAA